MSNVLLSGYKDLELSQEQRAELDRGLTIVTGVGIRMVAGAIATAYGEHLSQHMPEVGSWHKFSYLKDETDARVFEQIGVGLFDAVSGAIGYKRRTGAGDIIETNGFILYPPDEAGTGRHSDQFWGDRYVRLSLPVLGVGNFWSVTTGERNSTVSDLLIQDLGCSPSHEANTIGLQDPRAVAFWDIPADKVTS